MKKFTIFYLIILILVLTITTVLVQFFLLSFLNSDINFSYIFIPASFLLSGIVMMILINLTDRKNDKRFTQVILLTKTLKNFMVVIAGLIMITGFKTNIKDFLILTGVYYLVYLAFETIGLLRLEKILKHEKAN